MLLKELRHQVLKANVEPQQKGLALYTFGNASGISRRQGPVVIKPRGAPYDDLTIENLSCCTGNSPALEESRTPTQNMRRSGQARQPMRCFGTTHSHYCYAVVSVTRPMHDNKTASD
jgi:L-ribulose-5-phosphate 4-epimerase